MVFGLEQEDGSFVTPMALAHPFHPIRSRSMNKRRNLWVWWCGSSWRTWFWSINSISQLKYALSKRHIHTNSWCDQWWCVGWYDTVINSFVLGFKCMFQLYSWGFFISLQWRHNGRDGVSNHQPHDYLLNRLFMRRSKKTSKLRVTGLCAGNSPGTGEIPTQRASNAENVSIWWRHHDNTDVSKMWHCALVSCTPWKSIGLVLGCALF